jgi:hypothetical protein
MRYLVLLSLLLSGCGEFEKIAQKALPSLYNLAFDPDVTYDHSADDGFRGDVRGPDNPAGMFVQTVKDAFELDIELPWFLDDMTLDQFLEDAELTIFDDQNLLYGDFLSNDLFKTLKTEFVKGESVTFTLDVQNTPELLGGRTYNVNVKCLNERFSYLLKMGE